MDAIVIRTMSPHDITLDEAEEIAQAIRGLNLNCEVQVEGHERQGKGVTWFEVLHISLLAGIFAGAGKVLAEEAAKKIAAVFVDWHVKGLSNDHPNVPSTWRYTDLTAEY